MPLFEQTVPINRDDIAALVANTWKIKLGDIIKASQNHTFKAELLHDSEQKFVVRVTPDPDGQHEQRVRDETTFVSFLAQHRDRLQHVCAPVAYRESETAAESFILKAPSLLIVVYEWALGAPLNFMEFSWMQRPEVAFTWGRWFAQFHQLSRLFAAEHPEVAGRIQRWSDIHHGVLRNAPLSPEDVKAMDDPTRFGVIHGDLNISNFFYLPGTVDTLSVFDWDQVQRGWFMYDVAQAAFTVHMLAENGSIVGHAPVPEADPTLFEERLLAGYASIVGEESVDREQYRRMMSLRMYFYETFCRQAKAEGSVPPDMAFFIDYIIHWFDNRRSSS